MGRGGRSNAAQHAARQATAAIGPTRRLDSRQCRRGRRRHRQPRVLTEQRRRRCVCLLQRATQRVWGRPLLRPVVDDHAAAHGAWARPRAAAARVRGRSTGARTDASARAGARADVDATAQLCHRLESRGRSRRALGSGDARIPWNRAASDSHHRRERRVARRAMARRGRWRWWWRWRWAAAEAAPLLPRRSLQHQRRCCDDGTWWRWLR